MAKLNNAVEPKAVRHVFIIGAKSIGQYGGYETFVDRLIEEHENEPAIQYHIACKANGDGSMDENKLPNITITKKKKNGVVSEFIYRNAHIFKIQCPNIGPAVAIYYDRAALLYCIDYCKKYHINHAVFYVLTCRIGLFIRSLVSRIKAIGGKYYLNPDGNEWKRKKWSKLIRAYWKWSEKRMVSWADMIICDSVNIENYIRSEYGAESTVYIAYGADIEQSGMSDDNPRFVEWLKEKDLEQQQYYLVVGRFVPENNYEVIIREFMRSRSSRNIVLITNANKKLSSELEDKLHWKADNRIRFAGTVYDKELLKKIRENAYGYLHGHEVGGTNPSLLEGLGSTQLNLLLDVGFNKEVAQDAALYWNKEAGNLASLIDTADGMDNRKRAEYSRTAKKRIKDAYSWPFIANEYRRLWILNV